jgi:hypothetical protein
MDRSPPQPVLLDEPVRRSCDIKLAVQFPVIVILMTVGGALSRFVMIGLLGVPMFVTGAIWFLAWLIVLPARSGVPRFRSILGLLVIIVGWIALSCGVAVAPDGYFRSEDFYRLAHSFQLTGNPQIPLFGAAGPALIAVGLWLRTGWRPAIVLLAWIVLMTFVPLTVLAFYFMRGMPTTA